MTFARVPLSMMVLLLAFAAPATAQRAWVEAAGPNVTVISVAPSTT